MMTLIAALTVLQTQAHELFGAYPSAAQVAILERSKAASCDDHAAALSDDLEPARTVLILVGCSNSRGCQRSGRISRCAGTPRSQDKVTLVSW